MSKVVCSSDDAGVVRSCFKKVGNQASEQAPALERRQVSQPLYCDEKSGLVYAAQYGSRPSGCFLLGTLLLLTGALGSFDVSEGNSKRAPVNGLSSIAHSSVTIYADRQWT